MTALRRQHRPPPAGPPGDELEPEELAIIEALAEQQAVRDYRAAAEAGRRARDDRAPG